MKQYLQSLIKLFYFSDVDKEIYKTEIISENLRRSAILLGLAIPVTLGHISLFHSNLPKTTGIEHSWVNAIITIHQIVLSCAVLGLSIYLLKIKKSEVNWLREMFTNLVMAMLLVASIFLAIADQLISNVIYPFLFCNIIVGVVFYIQPRVALIYFSATYLLFYYLLPFGQSNAEILISNRVNALSYGVVGFALSVIFWKANLTRKSQAKLIQKQNAELIKQHKEKDQLFSIISHDLRGPIGGFLSLTDLLSEEAETKKDEELKSMMRSIKKSASNVFNLLENLLEWSRLRQNLIAYTPKVFNLQTLILETIKAIEDSALAKTIKIEISIPQEIEVTSDPLMVQTILRNFCSNAIKFTREGGCIFIGASTSNTNQLVISIRDTGIGMSKETIEVLFVLGSKNSRLGTNGEKSTGLGLIVCKELADKIGGEIWAESDGEKGSTFFLKMKTEIESSGVNFSS